MKTYYEEKLRPHVGTAAYIPHSSIFPALTFDGLYDSLATRSAYTAVMDSLCPYTADVAGDLSIRDDIADILRRIATGLCGGVLLPGRGGKVYRVYFEHDCDAVMFKLSI